MPIHEVDPTSKLPPLKQLDLALLDTAPVRERIKQWQITGGAVPPKEDDNAEASVQAESIKTTSSSLPSHTRSKSVEPQIADLPSTPTEPKTPERLPATDPVKPRIVERKPRVHRLDHELKKASAPKKRVVSDGHWVKEHAKPEETQPDPQYGWVREHAKPEEKQPEPQYGWVREHAKPEEKQPEPQHVWTRAPLFPRHQPEPLQKREIKVYAAHPRRKSFASPEQSGNSSEDVQKPPSPKKASPRKPASPKQISPPKQTSPSKQISLPKQTSPSKQTSPPKPNHENPTSQRTPHEFISDWARNVGPLTESVVADNGEDEPAPKTHRASRNRRATEAPPYYKEIPPTPKRTSFSQDQLSSPEASARPSHKGGRRDKSAENLNESDRNPRRRRSSLQQSPEQIEADEFTRHRRASHRRGKSVGAALTERTRGDSHNGGEEVYIHGGRRRASYREEFSRYAPTESVPELRVKPETQSRMSEQFGARPPDDVKLVEDPGSPKVYGSRIEAWLSCTPDPFNDAGSEGRQSRRVFSYEDKGTRRAPSTLDTASRQSDSFNMSQSSRKITNGTYSNHDREVLSPEQSEVLDPEIEVEHSSTTSVPSLKRRGARHNSPSPTKEPTKELTKSPSAADSKFESDIASSVVSSSVDASKFVPPDAPARHSANGAVRKLQFTSKRLSTIVSESTFKQLAQPSSSGVSEPTVKPEDDDCDTITHLTTNDEQSMLSTAKSRTSLKRRLTKHSDLMSVLSMDAPPKSKSIVSARSIRTHRSRLATATVADLMKEVASDETKYMRELKTLADGVILVLLKSVLSKSDAALAAGLYSRAPSSQDVTNATKLIRELGVALNRLKTLHSRIPKEDADAFLNWAQSAQKIYADYVRTWRMGFEDVVVNLTTDEDGNSTVSTAAKSVHGGSWDEGLPRNEDGYVVDGDGARVDVAFLLKRPLVRLKYLTKTVKGINFLKPSAKAESLEKTFQELMEAAKKRVNEEKARMEDESASMIDATLARDPKSLAPLKGVKIEPGRCVRARDYFDLHFDHSSGQAVDCRVELLLRDDPPGKATGGDLLVCEVDTSSRWLFLPPVELDRVSARKGDVIGEIVVMMRGMTSTGQEWCELLTLYNIDEDVGSEWVQMLGSELMPPVISELKSAMTEAACPTSSYISSSYLSDRTESTIPQKSRTPSPREIEIPIGERATSRSKRWGYETSERDHGYASGEESPITPPTSESDYSRVKKPLPKSAASDKPSSPWSTFKDKFTHKDELPKMPPSPGAEEARTPKDLNEAMDLAGSGSPGLKRVKAKRYRSSPKSSPTADGSPLRYEQEDLKLPEPTEKSLSPASPKKTQRPKDDRKRTTSKSFSVWMPPSQAGSDDESDEDDVGSHFSTSSTRPVLSQRPIFERRTSSVPSLDLPNLPKLRSSSAHVARQAPSTPERHPSKITSEQAAPASAPPKVHTKQPQDLASEPKSPDHDTPPPPPPHRTLSSSQTPSKPTPTPQFTPTPQLKRRSSSPLKHEYQPSSASSDDLSDDSASYHDSDSMTSDSEDELDDDDDTISYVMPSLAPKSKPPTPPKTLFSIPEATIKPADSASQIHAQAPYRQVPQTQPATGTSSKTIACLFGWAPARGSWEQLHPDECSIVVLPGLIAAYEMSSAHNSKGLGEAGARPLIAMELTPRVMIRRGTGLDISLRSPPTAASRLKPGDTVMFRSRSQEECEILYQLMLRASRENPTYIALQNARPQTPPEWTETMDRRSSGGDGEKGRWWNLNERSKSYRAASTRATSTSGNTDSSVRTISSVVDAMKRFSGYNAGSRIFSTVRDKVSAGGESASSGDGATTPPTFVKPGEVGVPEGLGITNAKIRLYVRLAKAKWQDLGSARLSVLQKRPDDASDAGVDTPVALQTGSEKRIVVVNKKGTTRLLDVTLGESCFERVARTGIAVSVWEDVTAEGQVAAEGGVADKRTRVYMIQLKSERECAYTFSLLGKLRY